MTYQNKQHSSVATRARPTSAVINWHNTLRRLTPTLALAASLLHGSELNAANDPDLLELPEPPVLESDVALSPDATGGYYLDISAAADLARYFDRCRAYPAAAHLVVRTNNSIWRDEMRGRLAAQELRHTAEAGGRWEWWEIGLLAGGVGVVSAAVGIGVGVGWAMSF